MTSVEFLLTLEKIIRERIESKSESSYTYRLYREGLEKIAKKVLEEAGEVVIAALREGRERTISEIADLLYHLLVLMYTLGISLEEVCRELERRHRERMKHETLFKSSSVEETDDEVFAP